MNKNFKKSSLSFTPSQQELLKFLWQNRFKRMITLTKLKKSKGSDNRAMRFCVAKGDELIDITNIMATLQEASLDAENCIKVKGSGMDMAWQTVYKFYLKLAYYLNDSGLCRIDLVNAEDTLNMVKYSDLS